MVFERKENNNIKHSTESRKTINYSDVSFNRRATVANNC